MTKTIAPGKPYRDNLIHWLKSSEKNQFAYLKASIEENSDMPEAIISALRDIAEAQGFKNFAQKVD